MHITPLPLTGERWTLAKPPQARVQLAPRAFLDIDHAARVIAAKATQRLTPLAEVSNG